MIFIFLSQNFRRACANVSRCPQKTTFSLNIELDQFGTSQLVLNHSLNYKLQGLVTIY